ncbi:hypothetical protein EV363DRAFT_1517656 [Boletus edulis]|nr:hypothetical protein EV363DRAFT_1517656 [Boletus edulis]
MPDSSKSSSDPRPPHQAFQREVEVERILKAFKLNPYDILDLDLTAKPEDIKRKYRQLSLFIHPDKTPHPRAPDAFDILKKVRFPPRLKLSDTNRRTELDAAIASARSTLLRALSLPSTLTDDDSLKEVLIEEEVRRRKAIKMNLANEGLEARKKEEEVATRKRKAEEDKAWEESRESRVGSWRSFNNSKKKKKGNAQILG